MSDIFEAIKENNLVVTVEPGHRRLAFELFQYKDGAVFFDVGWTEGFGHPIHVLPGPITGEYPRCKSKNQVNRILHISILILA